MIVFNLFQPTMPNASVKLVYCSEPSIEEEKHKNGIATCGKFNSLHEAVRNYVSDPFRISELLSGAPYPFVPKWRFDCFHWCSDFHSLRKTRKPRPPVGF